MDVESGTTDWLARAVQRNPGGLALADASGARLSYRELHERAREKAEGLSGTGPHLIDLPAGIDHAVAVHAAILAGVPFTTIRPGLPPAERGAVEAAATATVPGLGTLARVLSSGTTGPRKAVDLTAANFAASAEASARNLGVDPADVWLACLPMDHVGGLSILIRSAIYGTAALIHERFDADAVASAVAAEEPRVTLVSLVPTQLHRLLDIAAPLDRVRVALIGGGALDRRTLDRALETGVPVVQTYGMTEACSQVCTLSPGEADAHRGSSGRALPGIEVEVGAAGRIRVRGANVAPAAAGPGGWLDTGDSGRLDDDGYLWVEGRADDVIVTGGENVRPEPVEEVLLGDPAVADAAVVGRPDPEWGQRVVAVVVPVEGGEPDPEALIARCRAELAPAMVPKAVEFANELPRTAAGKLRRGTLRDRV